MTLSGHIIGHKYWELQIEILTEWSSIFESILRWNLKGDHAGLKIYFEILKFMFSWQVYYDSRHWNYEMNRFYYEGEPEDYDE